MIFYYFIISIENLLLVTGPLNEVQIAYMCRETLQGLAYLHTMGKMHRDIKVMDSLHWIHFFDSKTN